MGLRDVVLKALGYKLGGREGGFRLFEMATAPSWNYQSYLKAYGEIGWLFACVNVIAQSVAKVKWHLYKSGEDRQEIEEHELLELMHKVNNFQTWYQFVYLGTMYKCLVGEQFWQLNFNGGGRPAEMWLAPPAYMSVIPSATEYISHYEYRRDNYVTRFDKKEIIHIMTPNPFNPYRGLSPAQALTIDLDSERYAARYQQKLFFNDATPGFVLEYPADNLPSREQRQELMMDWDERHKGYRQRGKTAFLFGAKANVLTMSNKDMDFSELRKFNRDAILGAYHVPRSVLGITEDVNRANAEAAQYSFAAWVVHPELCQLRESLNEQLVPLFGEGIELDFDNPIPEDVNSKSLNAEKLYKGGIITRDEARALVDFEPAVEGGEEFFSQPVPTFGQPPEPPMKELKGGGGSGNFGHEGRPGEVGGSGEGGGAESSARADRARASYKPSSRSVQRTADKTESSFAKTLQADRTADNAAFDLLKGDHAIEVKTIVRAENAKITMHPESLARKVAYAKANGLRSHTVVLDARSSTIYYREGLGSFRLSSMRQVSHDDLKGIFR